ncbi:nicotinamide adenine dinucleotide transporter 2, mitochondrial-like isoform X1 [Miscanthus floridulus]|uniref:nicotinamide adenine dinucleotide transporter 2, mitochondrial-like isoform X1 n=1 Tax=Miscanthus floridulus TaxID=154761 RepID=UPI003457BA48
MSEAGRRGAREKLREAACNAVAGGLAGVISATVLCPLDVIKTRLQVYGLPSNFSGAPPPGRVIISGFQQILKNEGLPGLYRGLSPTIVALFPTWAVTFSVYNHMKGVLHSKDSNNGELSVQANVLAASCAGIATATATNPLWVVKTRLQTQGMRPGVVPYQSILSALQRIAKEEGIRGLYSGLLPSLVGVAHVAIQLPVYEKVKLYFARRDNTTVYNLSPTQVAICSSGSKVAASIITYPHEVVRSKLQEQGRDHHGATRYSGVADCIKQVYQKEGFPGFYRGCATNLLRTTPNAVITFTSYEMISRLMHQLLAP